MKRTKLKYVNKPFAGFKSKHRATLVLDLAGFTAREIATLLKISTSTVTRYIERGYIHIGDRLKY